MRHIHYIFVTIWPDTGVTGPWFDVSSIYLSGLLI